MSNQTIDPYKFLQIVPSADGTLSRLLDDPRTILSSDANANANANTTPLPTTSILTKDVTINSSNNTWLRIFLPQKATQNHTSKLPLIVFFHGSGFIVQSAASTKFHLLCEEMADTIEAVVASVDYRLAPEHRLPAAYDDAMEALRWIGHSQDEWLTKYVDYSNCYLMGNSSGATIVYHAGLRIVEDMDLNLINPLKIQGLILRQPFFGGTKRTESELRLENDPDFPLCASDLMWELALPFGVDRDHEYCNIRSGNGVHKLDRFRKLGWRVLVSGNGGDLLVDREKELVQLMEEKGVQVVKDFQEEGCHGVEFFEPSILKQLIGLVKDFISK